MQFSVYALGKLASQLSTLGKRDILQGNQRKHIGSPYARMLAMMVVHIDEFTSLAYSTESCFYHFVRLANKCYYRTIGSLAPIYM